MFIHFAFSSNRDNPDIQIKDLIRYILTKRRLKFGLNPEFIPIISPKHHPRFSSATKLVKVPLGRAHRIKGGVEIDIYPAEETTDNPFSPLSEDIPIISFMEVLSAESATTSHAEYYGTLGLIFNSDFLSRSGLTKVKYYTEESLPGDELVRELNKYAYRLNLSRAERKKKRDLEIKLRAYRKPATLSESITESYRINLNPEKPAIQKGYERYPSGYNFAAEHEWRINGMEKEGYLHFEEQDLEAITAPSGEAKERLLLYFHKEWEFVPHIYVYPQVSM